MPSINSVVSQANSVASLSTKFFGGNREAASHSVLVQPGYNNFINFLKSEFGGQPAITTLVENYNNNRESFNETLKENMDSLKESSDKVKAASQQSENPKTTSQAVNNDSDNDKNTGSALSTLGGFANGNIPPQERNLALSVKRAAPKPEVQAQKNSLNDFAKEYLTAEKNSDANAENSNEDSRITSVKNLVRDFNSAMSYLNENRGVSDRMSALADNFNNGKLNDSLNEIGISVNSQGILSIDENTLSQAVNNNSDTVDSALGSEGLSGQLERNINLVNYQGDRLFGSILDFANQKSPAESESLYGNNAAYAQENSPRIFALFT